MTTAVLGVAFLIVGFAAMFLMYRLWGYPFDHERKVSAAPRWAMRLHRGLGYVFVAIYIVLMWHMVPRLWQYQIEFPARTAIHIVLGFTIGFLLLIKIAILRFFRHFEEWMPVLGTSIMCGTVILLGLSLPFVLQERALARSAPGGDAFSAQSQARVAQLLPMAKLPSDAVLASLSTSDALGRGRQVLLDTCVKCHDLKTILAKPRPPEGWWEIVTRMAEKPALFTPMTETEQYEVTAYLIAITPDLQKAAKRKREEKMAHVEAMTQMIPLVAPADPAAPPAAHPIDLAVAKRTFGEQCSQCHEVTQVDDKPPTSPAECKMLVQRMVTDNEAKITPEQIELITAYLTAHYVDKSAP